MHEQLFLPVGPRDHVRGSDQAMVTLVEYGDYQCPYCGAAFPIVKALEDHFGPELRVVFRNFPLRELHAHAEAAAEAAEAAAAQGRFWQMHDILFENQADLSERALASYGRLVVDDPERWQNDIKRRVFLGRVEEDFLSGVQSGVSGTPTFYLNGRRHEGSYKLEVLARAVEAELRALREYPGSRDAACAMTTARSSKLSW
jgi:protein-disulfide isomerase